MKVLLKKNIRYKNKSYIAGKEIDIDEKDLNDFQNADVIEKVGDNVKAKVKIKRNVENTEEVHEVQKSEPLKDDLSITEKESNINAYEDMTKAEIGEILTLRGIDHSSKELKENLIELLLGSE